MANLNGLSQAGAPVMMRGSTSRPPTDATAATSISAPTAVSGALARHRRRSRAAAPVLSADGTAGETIFKNECSVCHAEDLTGADGPELPGDLVGSQIE